MSKKILILASIILIPAVAYLIYKINFENPGYAWLGGNDKWKAEYRISRTSANEMYSGELRWVGEASEKQNLYISHIDTFFNGNKIDVSEINNKPYENMPFAEFQQNVKKDTAIKIIIYGTNGNKKFTEELSLSIEN
ncbi:hypothetical protein [Listeria booriae]|uniref:hypothetical protein n=1 Tax=Listeria booriae TaxID=1552123 RepID=UPI001628DC02|nr:hypothetical protein [Listeria booriae]MBC1975463.1 hypothetical protein [Listeria booriae]MBC1984888.1 hypothetical protein [Listeria booriae]MBC2032860.1 hypothetical protein [Listeria booriae]MBC2048724.1 hypothetical protein [Listeria booriae]